MKTLFYALFLAVGASPDFPPALSPSPQAIATFESVGLYWKPPQEAAGQACTVTYREVGAGDKAWQTGYPLWFDTRNGEYRGSIVGLTPGTGYEFHLDASGKATTDLHTTTWPETFPVAETIFLPAGEVTEPIVIERGGSPEGYVLYTPPSGEKTIVCGQNKIADTLIIRASYVIIRGVTLTGAQRNGILLDGPVHNVVIEQCDISDWGRVAPDGWAKNMDSGIRGDSPEIRQIVIQRNRIHHPRANSNDWSQARPATGERMPAHPNGPQGIALFNSRGNHVIRYNEIFSDERHRFNDGMGAGSNFSYQGFPGPDSDIYGNLVRNVCDDGIEVEGGGRNVRVWGNAIDTAYVGVATAACSIGPLYVFRNVLGVTRKDADSDNPDNRGSFAKVGDKGDFGGGRQYFFHNTVLQPLAPVYGKRPLGARVGVGDWGGSMNQIVSRNNIWWVASVDRQRWPTRMNSYLVHDKAQLGTNDFDYDLFNGTIRTQEGVEAHGIQGEPLMIAGWESWIEKRTAPTPDPGSPSVGKAISLPNFNAGPAPDMGAVQRGASALEFGVAAAPSHPSAAAPAPH